MEPMTPPQSAALPLFCIGVALVALCARMAGDEAPEPWEPQPQPFAQQEPAEGRWRGASGVVPPRPVLDLDRLYLALVEVESGGDPRAVGDGGRAVGVLQIHPIMVRDLNRIAGRERWSLDSRLSPTASRAMLEEYLDHYGAASYEEAARKWNGGPDGHTQGCTLGYWDKVRAELLTL
jgi:hypothetical protein